MWVISEINATPQHATITFNTSHFLGAPKFSTFSNWYLISPTRKRHIYKIKFEWHYYFSFHTCLIFIKLNHLNVTFGTFQALLINVAKSLPMGRDNKVKQNQVKRFYFQSRTSHFPCIPGLGPFQMLTCWSCNIQVDHIQAILLSTMQNGN